jgi:hypothetical protein
MSFLDDLKHVIEKGADDIKHVAEDVDGAVDRAVSIARSGFADVEKEVQKIIAAGEKAIMQDLVNDALGKYGSTIKSTLGVLGKDALNALAGDLQTLQSSITGKHLSDDARNTLKSVLASDVVQKAVGLAKSQFKAVSLAAGGNAAFMVGLEGCYGGAISFDGKEQRAMVGVGAMGGISEGAEANLQVGIWNHSPKHLKGGYAACEVTLGVEAGLGVQFVFDMPSTDYIGFVVAVMGGEEASLDFAAGYTYTFE